ncbi:hypothetical protein [Gracilibacillus suaedae]|uniref:hypothetical protein n=1 Tax=Gracilibacillus suaedae TaxID=2820273 RepID=UPI001ABE693C|nr:hypothetical protein [Gracilibacillus suaedae]
MLKNTSHQDLLNELTKEDIDHINEELDTLIQEREKGKRKDKVKYYGSLLMRKFSS